MLGTMSNSLCLCHLAMKLYWLISIIIIVTLNRVIAVIISKITTPSLVPGSGGVVEVVVVTVVVVTVVVVTVVAVRVVVEAVVLTTNEVVDVDEDTDEGINEDVDASVVVISAGKVNVDADVGVGGGKVVMFIRVLPKVTVMSARK